MTKPEIDPSVAEVIEEALREVAIRRPADPVAFMADRLAAESKLNVDDYAAAHSERIRALRNLRGRAESFWKVVLEDPQHTIDRTGLREVYPELYYFRIINDEVEESAVFDRLCAAIEVMIDILTADTTIVRYYKPFDGVGDYRRTVGKEYSRRSVTHFLGAMIPGLVARAGEAKGLDKLIPNIHNPFSSRNYWIPRPDEELRERDAARVADKTDWRDWDTVERRLDLLVVRLIMLRLLDNCVVHEKLDSYAEDYTERFVRDGMGPREGAGKYYAMLLESPRFLSLFPSFKKYESDHKHFLLSWLRTGFPLRDLPRGRFITAHFEILREETLALFPPLSLEIVVQGLVGESIYDHWDEILPRFDPDLFCIEVQIAAEAICVCRYYPYRTVQSYLGLRYKHIITPACLKLGEALPSQWWESYKPVKRIIVKFCSKPGHFIPLRDALHGRVLTEEQLVTLVSCLNKDGLSRRPVLLPEGVEEFFEACIDNPEVGPCWALGALSNILGRAMKEFGKIHARECVLIIDLRELSKRIEESPDEYGYDTHRSRVYFHEIGPVDRGPLMRRTGRLIPYLDS
ncbi:hypothetical protein FOL46_004539 [Perkinsus olseni]|uniref:Uncharacterized protein n=1 Tax=Perkinsus olseni TaxID=32597 RepID=A0A7J6LXA5_PEROL|nr:hypothetical protein FOL46_004539 [Perkinsus olseni]